MSDQFWNKAAVIATNAVIFAGVHWLCDNTDGGKRFKDFCQNWRADNWLHGIMCSVTVFIFGVLAFFSLGLLLRGCDI